MNLKARLHALPLPVSAIAFLAAFVAANLDFQHAGWVLFGVGIVAWARFDAKQLLRADRYGLPPALALLAYPALAGDQASTGITFALALHALVVFLILTSRHLSQDIAQDFLSKKA